MATKINQQGFSEDEFGQKIDRCLTDTLVKAGTTTLHYIIGILWMLRILLQTHFLRIKFAGGGLVIGGVLSLLFFKRRAFPLWVGTGFGVGVGYRNCELALNSTKK